jgi:HK97 gp10 family phage protein
VANTDLTDNTSEVFSMLEHAKARALEIIGGKIESYAKGLCPVDTGALRNSITHQVDGDTVVAGSAVYYAPYVELGTGKEYDPPPEWMENNAQRGAGIAKHSVKPRPYLRPAVENHVDEYKNIMESTLKNA